MSTDIQIELIKLKDGRTLLRLEDEASGLSLEKRLDPAAPLVMQKARWLRVFQAMLDREIAAV